VCVCVCVCVRARTRARACVYGWYMLVRVGVSLVSGVAVHQSVAFDDVYYLHGTCGDGANFCVVQMCARGLHRCLSG